MIFGLESCESSDTEKTKLKRQEGLETWALMKVGKQVACACSLYLGFRV